MRSLAAHALLLAVALLAGASSAQNGCSGSGADDTADLTITQDDLTSAHNARVGDSIAVSLPATAGTGYSWRISWTPQAALEQKGDEFVADHENLPGSSGRHVFVLEAKQAGEVTVTVQYGRWWEGGEREEPQTFTIMIRP